MGAALLLGLFAAIMVPWLGDDDAVDEDPIATDPPIDTGNDGTPNYIEIGPLVEGTDGSDIFNLDNAPRDSLGSLEPVTINANGGDDIIALTPEAAVEPEEFGPDAFYQSSISGGAGDDMIEVSAYASTVSGDEGNDTITVYGMDGNDIFGGAGDDLITGTQGGSSLVTIDGGSGNDTIDGRHTFTGRILGGDGDDVLLFGGADEPSAAFILHPDRGAGDDLLIYEGSPILPAISEILRPINVNGGEGSDTFSVTFDEGEPLSNEDLPEDTDLVTLGLIRIDDFEPGIDTLEIDASVTNSAYELSEVRLEEQEANGTTSVIVSYTSETEVNRDVVITVNATGVDIDDLVLPDGLVLDEVA